MKIVIATAVYYPMTNGVAVFSHNLAMGLKRRGHDVLVITPSQNGKTHFEVEDGVRVAFLKSMQLKLYPDQIHSAKDGIDTSVKIKKTSHGGKEIHAWRWHLPWYRYGFRVSVFPEREVREILEDFVPDVVHVQVSDPIGLSVVGFAKRYHIPVVMTEHNQPEVLTSSLHLGLLRRPTNALLVAYLRKRLQAADFVTMPTKEAIIKLLKNTELRAPIAAVSNGVDLKDFHPGEVTKEIYQKYHLSPEDYYLLYVGRLDPEKNVELIIRAFKKARPELPPQAQLLIVGDGTDKDRLEKMAAHEAGIRFLGRMTGEELYAIYRVGKIFVTASEVETEGIVLIEAAATGLPLIAVNKGAVCEICQNNINGLLTRAGDVDELAQAMAKIATDEKLRAKFSQKSLEIAREHDLEKTLDRFENIYRRVSQRGGE